jgi:hypothetical protein
MGELSIAIMKPLSSSWVSWPTVSQALPKGSQNPMLI